ncbi:MAG TPA: TMEM165/GDT1 family protein [Burkholderiales bacterium]|nr:TMEM165/GDT1 family protein [Burkholderiales bacterium]
MTAFLTSLLVVAVAEFGDKTQLLSLLLATRFKKPWPIILAILCATILNHALAGWIGELVRAHLDPAILRWVLGGSLLAVALWTLKPDKFDDAPQKTGHYGVFVVSFVAFFLAEMGDKTQIATVLLAAKYDSLVPVVLGTTTGMMVANVPAVLLGNFWAHRIPLAAVRVVAALLFAVMGVLALLGKGIGVG